MKTEYVSNNLSELIRQLFSEFSKPGVSEIPGLSITIKGFSRNGDVNENINIRSIIDSELKKHRLQSVRTIANTIFPINLWNPELGRDILFKRYDRIRPKLKVCKDNKEGLYFERMIDYDNKSFNQLDKVIEIYENDIHRRSAHQISIWDPIRDLKNKPYSVFPCLQHIVFQCVRNELILVAFYATQYVFERAYGNFLGLCNLGQFMSHELNIPLTQVKCYIGVELFDNKNISKTEFKEIFRTI